jgi:hypothetical protein
MDDAGWSEEGHSLVPKRPKELLAGFENLLLV